jgi:hypothetical protein
VQPSVSKSAPWWLWPTILSLDAPAVALAWQDLLARAAGSAATPAERFVLGSSVWLAYSADRWIEGWRLAPDQIQTHRHRFYQQWRWPLFVAWAVVLAADVAVAVCGLTHAGLEAGALLLLLVAAYLLSHQLVHRGRAGRAPKEACVAFLLGSGAVVFTLVHPGATLRTLVLPLGLFMVLCFANCALISVWEDEVDRRHGQTSLALQFRAGSALARGLPWAVAALAAVSLVLGPPADRAAAASAAVSGVLLAIVNRSEPRTGRRAARVLADAVLLTPLVPLILGGRS